MRPAFARFLGGVRPDVSQHRLGQLHASASRSGKHQPGPKESIAVVVPCYGHVAYVGALVESLALQTRPPNRVLFVDDASPDGMGELLPRLASSLATRSPADVVVLTNSVNEGQCATLNRAISASGTDLVLVANDDDYLMHDCVEQSLVLHRSHPTLALIGATSIHFSTDQQLANAGKLASAYAGEAAIELDVRTTADVLRYARASQLNMTHTGCSFTRRAWEKVGGYESDSKRRVTRFSDRDFQMRVNAVYPVGVSAQVPLSLWRANSSVDAGRNS